MTVPPLVAVGDRVTAAARNNDIAWWDGTAQAYSPQLTASTTDPGLGAGATALGRFRQVGKHVNAEVTFLFGTSGVTAGNGTFFVSLPVNTTNSVATFGTRLGAGEIKCAGVWTQVAAYVVLTNPTVLKLKYVTAAVGGSFTDVGSSTPGVWAYYDAIYLNLSYEAA